MAQVDKLIERMTQRQIERVVIVGGQPMRLVAANQETAGAVVEVQSLETMLSEVAPSNLLQQLERDGIIQFAHSSQHGTVNVAASRSNGALQVSIALTPPPIAASTPDPVQAPSSRSATAHSLMGLQASALLPAIPIGGQSGWYYAQGGEELGPVSADKLSKLISWGAIKSDTLVWQHGMKEWRPASLTDLNALLPPDKPALPSSAPAQVRGNDSGMGPGAVLPDELQEFRNWGAALLFVPWFIVHKAWVHLITCLVLVPLWIFSLGVGVAVAVGTGYSVVAGICEMVIVAGLIFIGLRLRSMGTVNQIAWQNIKWDSIEQFQEVQSKWELAGWLTWVGTSILLCCTFGPLPPLLFMLAASAGGLVWFWFKRRAAG